MDICMGLLKKTSASLEVTELKKHKLRKAILVLFNGWKDLEEHLDSTQISFQESQDELEAREKYLSSVQESVFESNKELESIRVSIEQRMENLENKEKEFKAFQEEQMKEFDFKEKGLGLDLARESAECEERMNTKQELVERLCERFELERKQFESIQKSVGEKLVEINLKEEQLENREKVLDEFERNLEKHSSELDSKEKQFGLELEFRGKELDDRESWLEKRASEFELRLENCGKELDDRESCLEKRASELELRLENRGKELDDRESCLEKRANELELRLENCGKELDDRESCLEKRANELDLRLENRGKELDDHESCLEKRAIELELRMENRGKELDDFEKCLETRSNELDSKEEQLESVQNSIDEYQRQLEIKEKQLESLEKSNEQCAEERAEELDSRMKQLESVEQFRQKWFKEFRSKKKQLSITQELLVERGKELDSKEKKLESLKEFNQQCHEEFQSKMKQLSIERKLLEERSKELDSKEKQLAPANSKSAEDFAGGCAIKHSPSDLDFFIDMDGRSLQIFLNQQAQNLDAMGDEVSRVLGLSLDPARVVLDAMEGFYPPHLKNGDVEFEASVVRSSCILLLEQLIVISPQIQSNIKDEALELASEWKAKMTAVVETSLEVLGFLHLVAAYGLASAFVPLELLSYVQLIAHCRQAPELCRLLGYVDKIPDLKQKQAQIHSKAIVACEKTEQLQKFGYKQMSSNTDIVDSKPISKHMAFILANMNGKYLLYLLNNHFQDHELLRKEVSMALQTAFDSPKLVLDAIEGLYRRPKSAFWKFDANVIGSSCILLLEELMRLSPLINPSVKERALKLMVAWTEIMKTKIEDPSQIICFLKVVVCFGLVSAFDSNELVNLLETLPQHRHVDELYELLGLSKRIPENSQLSSTDASLSLGSFCDEKYLNTCKDVKRELDNVVCDGIPTLLCCASEPTKLVLDAFRGFYYSEDTVDKKSIPYLMQNLFVLLRQLMKVQGEIKPHIKEEAMKLAAEWKARFVRYKRVSSEILAYLQLLATYKLSTSADADELINHFNTVCKREEAPDLFKALDIADKMTDLIQNFIKREEYVLALKYIYAFDLVEIIPPVSVLKSHLRSAEELSKKICSKGNDSAEAHAKARETEVGALFSVIRCIEKYGLEVKMSPKNLKERIRQLRRKPKYSSKAFKGTKKRPARVSHLISNSQLQKEKRPRIATAESPPTVPVGNAYAFHSLQAPHQLGQLTVPVQDGCSLRGATPHYNLRGSTPMIPLSSNPSWHYGPQAAASHSSVYHPLHKPEYI